MDGQLGQCGLPAPPPVAEDRSPGLGAVTILSRLMAVVTALGKGVSRWPVIRRSVQVNIYWKENIHDC